MVAQQQPKSLQCHYFLEHASQPQSVTVNNQLRSKRSSDFVTLRSKVQELYLLHTVSCGQKRHAKNKTVFHSTCTKQGCLRQCRSDRCWLAKTFGGQTKPTTNLSLKLSKMHCRSDRCCVAKTLASRGAHHCMRPIFHCMCPGRRGQKRRTLSQTDAVRITACTPFFWWPRRGQKRHMRGHCHLWHAGTCGICEVSPQPACHCAASAQTACRCRVSVWIQSDWKWQHSSKSIRYSRRSNSSSVRFTWGHSPWSRKIFKMATASATVRCFRRLSHVAGLSPRSCGQHPPLKTAAKLAIYLCIYLSS